MPNYVKRAQINQDIPFPMVVMTVVSIPSIVEHSILVPLRPAVVLLISNKDVSGDKEVLEMRTLESLMTNGGRLSDPVVEINLSSTSSKVHLITVPFVIHNRLNRPNEHTNPVINE